MVTFSTHCCVIVLDGLVEQHTYLMSFYGTLLEKQRVTNLLSVYIHSYNYDNPAGLSIHNSFVF